MIQERNCPKIYIRNIVVPEDGYKQQWLARWQLELEINNITFELY